MIVFSVFTFFVRMGRFCQRCASHWARHSTHYLRTAASPLLSSRLRWPGAAEHHQPSELGMGRGFSICCYARTCELPLGWCCRQLSWYSSQTSICHWNHPQSWFQYRISGTFQRPVLEAKAEVSSCRMTWCSCWSSPKVRWIRPSWRAFSQSSLSTFWLHFGYLRKCTRIYLKSCRRYDNGDPHS